MASDRHLVIMAKAPRLGRVKTRLAAGIGPVAAWAFYRLILAGTTRRLARDRRWSTWLCVAPDRAVADRIWWPANVAVIGQGTGDLGARMQRVFERLSPGPVVIIGADIPGIRPAHIAEAFHKLGRDDAVFGPAPDGGYWLIGLKRRPVVPQPFAGVRWSTEHALADTRANLESRRVGFIDTLDDVDDQAAYERWAGRRCGVFPV